MPGSVATQQFARRLKAARLAAGITQAELGVRIGLEEDVASTRINRYEKAVHKADIETIEKMARELGVPAAYLLAGDDRLAKAILGFAILKPSDQDAVLAEIKKLAPTLPDIV
jgi:transcriptional regulator with XRE-family HTH domain